MILVEATYNLKYEGDRKGEREGGRESSTGMSCIHYFPIVHNALCLPPKFCINYCCEILLGGLHIPKSIPQQ